MGATKKTRARKTELWTNIQDACQKYQKALFVNTDNVTSLQIAVMRKAMRAIGALMVCGKNTFMKKAINALNEREGVEKNEIFDKIVSQLRGNISIVFADCEMGDIQKILDSQVREAPARVGSLAPKEVIIKAGATGLDPRQTGFFGNLGIATKIVKAQIEILNDFKIIAEGDKISPGQSALLDKLKIRPFEYKMTIKKVMLDGQLFDPAVLRITPEDVLAKFSAGISNITALSLSSGYVVPSATPHLIMNAFKNLVAVSMATDYSFPAAEALKKAAAAGPAAAAPAAAGKKEEKKAEKEASEEEEDVDMGNMFGDDY